MFICTVIPARGAAMAAMAMAAMAQESMAGA